MALKAKRKDPTKEPKSLKSAFKQSNWVMAMEEEVQALEHNRTWTLVPGLNNDNIIGSKWIFKIKYKKDGSMDITKGFSQILGLDLMKLLVHLSSQQQFASFYP